MRWTRDELIMATADLFGYSEYDFDGYTAEDIWNEIDGIDQVEVNDYLAD